MTTERTEHLFVYGTLRAGFGGAMARLLAAHGELVGEAGFQGKLFLVADYPAAIASSDPSDRVAGEVYRLISPPLLLEELDRYEGCRPDPPGGEYVRSLAPVTLANGRALDAWIYLYNRPTDGLARIESGDFLRAPGGLEGRG